MRFGVLGTGMVGQAIAGKLVGLGHEVKMGSRQAGNEKAVAWASEAGDGASEGSFADAAGFGEVVVNATAGARRSRRSRRPGRRTWPGKVLIDVANALDFSQAAADADGLQRRQPRRADSAGVSGGPGGEGAEHDERRA